MTDSFRRHTSSLPVVIVLAGLCWFALGCGLFGEGRQETVPTPEPDFEATISAALQNVRAAQQAADPTLTPTAEPIATMAPSPTAPAVATGDQVAALSVVSPDARWGDLFTTFTEAEQSCIRDELGDEQLAAALESSIYHEEETQEWEVAIFDCLGQETAAALYHAFIVAPDGSGSRVDRGEHRLLSGPARRSRRCGLGRRFGARRDAGSGRGDVRIFLRAGILYSRDDGRRSWPTLGRRRRGPVEPCHRRLGEHGANGGR